MSVPFDEVAITSITRSGSTATATVVSTASLYDGQTVLIYGADQAAYNGVFNIDVTGATTFTYTVSGTPATPATVTAPATLGFRAGGFPFQPLLNGPVAAWVIAYHSAALENFAHIKASPGTLTSFYGSNVAGAGCWIMLFDSVAQPADGDLPLILDACAAQDNFYVDVPEGGIRFNKGIWAVASTSGTVLATKADSMTHFDALFHD